MAKLLPLASKQQYDAAIAQMNRAGKIAASKPQGMGWKAQLEVLACAMTANLIKTDGEADGFNKVVKL